jgi:hypothetical protein
MPAPIDYGVQIADPTQAFLGAFQTGASIREAGLKQEQQTQQMAQQKLIQDGFAKLRGPNATAADYANLSMMLPETQAQSIRKSFEMLSGERQNVALQQAGQVFSAFKAKKPEIAIGLLDQQIEGKRTSGDEAGAKFLETWRNVAKENPQATEDYFGFTISQMPGGKDVISSAISLSQEGRAAAEAPAGLREKLAKADKAEADALIAQEKAITAGEIEAAALKLAKAQADREATLAEFERAKQVLNVRQQGLQLGLTESQIKQAEAAVKASDAAAKKSGADATLAQKQADEIASGVIPLDKRPEAEAKFRKEYSDQTKGYQDVKSAYGRILAVSDPKTPDEEAPADLALVFNFMKMQDTGSTVNSGEFANAQNAAGVPDRIRNVYNNLVTGGRLNPTQRKAFRGQAENLFKVSGQQEDTVRKGIGRIAKGYGLNTQNIFYTETEVAPTALRPPEASGNSVTVNGKTYTRPANFTDAQWGAYKQSMGVQ